MWCFMLNSGPGLQIVFHCKIKCMVLLKWQFEEFFQSVAAAFLCVALGRLRETLEPGVRWSQGSSLNLCSSLDTAPEENILHSLCWDSRCQIQRETVIAFPQSLF